MADLQALSVIYLKQEDGFNKHMPSALETHTWSLSAEMQPDLTIQPTCSIFSLKPLQKYTAPF